MSDFEINKGVGREVEFKGLRAQYLFIFAFGLLAVFVVFVIMYTAGIGQWTCIGFGVSAATAVVWLTLPPGSIPGESSHANVSHV